MLAVERGEANFDDGEDEGEGLSEPDENTGLLSNGGPASGAGEPNGPPSYASIIKGGNGNGNARSEPHR